tara:strand:- start:69 stop:638 length:570 start_codon:yes stop_codon:yes gene_type:complete
MIVTQWGGSVIIETFVAEPKKWSSELLEQFLQNRNSSEKSHKIGGRWENQYLEIDTVPGARAVMRQARDIGKDKLGISSIILYESPPGSQNPYPPFWFNVAGMGEITGLHDHAHLSILSGVIYLQAGEGCGDLYFRKEGVDDLNIRPDVGKMVLFPPFLRHGVHSNESSKERISFAFNLFPFPLTLCKL